MLLRNGRPRRRRCRSAAGLGRCSASGRSSSVARAAHLRGCRPASPGRCTAAAAAAAAASAAAAAAAAAVSQDCDDDFGERIWELIWGTDFPESVPQISAANPALKAICSWPSAGCSRHARDVQAQFARTGFSPPLLPTTFLWLELDILNPGRRWSA